MSPMRQGSTTSQRVRGDGGGGGVRWGASNEHLVTENFTHELLHVFLHETSTTVSKHVLLISFRHGNDNIVDNIVELTY